MSAPRTSIPQHRRERTHVAQRVFTYTVWDTGEYVNGRHIARSHRGAGVRSRERRTLALNPRERNEREVPWKADRRDQVRELAEAAGRTRKTGAPCRGRF